MKDLMVKLNKRGYKITATSVPLGDGEMGVVVDAKIGSRRAVVVWNQEGEGWPAVDTMTDEESDDVFQIVSDHFWPVS